MRNAENLLDSKRESLRKWIERVSASRAFNKNAEFFRDEEPLGFKGRVTLPERKSMPDNIRHLHHRAGRLSEKALTSDTPWLLYEQAARFEELALNLLPDADGDNIRRIGMHAVKFAERAGNDAMVLELGHLVFTKLGDDTGGRACQRIERMMAIASLRVAVDASLSARSGRI